MFDNKKQLLLFRHGIAEDHGPEGTDASRRLTEEGVKKTQQSARGLVTFADPPDVILTSPKVRAMQTAELVGEAFDQKPQTLEVLANGNAQQIIDAVSERAEERIVIVGHEPMFSEIVERLTAGRATDNVRMKKAGCACLECSGSTGELQWLVTPKILRALAT